MLVQKKECYCSGNPTDVVLGFCIPIQHQIQQGSNLIVCSLQNWNSTNQPRLCA